MSRTELNKGKLIPTHKTVEEYANEVITGELPSYYSSKKDALLDEQDEHNITVINNMVYRVEFEIRRGYAEEFADARKNEDGSIEFMTCHYNGGAHWTEVVEEVLKEKKLLD